MIQCRDLTKVFWNGEQQIRVIDRLDFAIATGERVALLGRSGSGKSSLLHLLAGMDMPTEGEIEVGQKSLRQMSPTELSDFRLRDIGIVFQSFQLIPQRTAFENVELPLLLAGMRQSQRRVRVREALARVGLEHRMDHRPSQLSGGEQQRVAIARAIMNDPKVLFADEPTGNLDCQTAGRVLELIREIAKERGTTLLVITHDQEVAHSVAYRTLHLVDGKLSLQPSADTVDAHQASRLRSPS